MTEFTQVIKRDGTIETFNPTKILNAIRKAMVCSHVKDTHKESMIVTDNVLQALEKEDKKCFEIEHIQDVVEKELMRDFPDVAKAYILYRNERSRIRENKSELIQIVEEKLFAKNVQNQNANMDENSFGGRLGEMRSAVVKRYALEKCMSKMSRDNHLNNLIYIHDLDSYAVGMHNCMTIPFDNLLANGFDTRNCDVRPANSVNTAFQLVAVLFQLQSLQQFGGVSASHLDWTMVPYVRKSFKKHLIDGMKYIEKKSDYKIERFKKWLKYDPDHPDELIHFDDEDFKKHHEEAWQYAMDMTEKETCQAVEGMYHNLNTLQSRSGNQLPFTSINYGTCTLPEGRLVIKALLEGSIKGVGIHNSTSIFPCGIFQYMKGVNDKPGTPNYDLFRLALKSTAKRLYPNYVNIDWSGNKGYDPDNPCTYMSTMGKCKCSPCKISRTSA